MNCSWNQDTYEIESASAYVKIRYRVKIVGGPVIKGANELETMDFVTGYGHVIPGLEKRLIGARRGQKMVFEVPAEEAFGIRDEKLVFVKNKEDFHFPPGFLPYPGMEISLINDANEGPDSVRIKEVREDGIVIDFNHTLAGFALGYELEIIEARPSRASDVCAEWDKKPEEHAPCSCVPHEIVLGKDS